MITDQFSRHSLFQFSFFTSFFMKLNVLLVFLTTVCHVATPVWGAQLYKNGTGVVVQGNALTVVNLANLAQNSSLTGQALRIGQTTLDQSTLQRLLDLKAKVRDSLGLFL